MQYSVKGKAMGHKAAFVIVVTGAISHFPVTRRLKACANACRMGHLILEQIPRDSATAKGITVIEAKSPFQHFILFHLRRKTTVEFTTPAKMLGEVITPVSQLRHLDLIRFLGILVIETVTSIDGKQVIRQNLEAKARRNIREVRESAAKL